MSDKPRVIHLLVRQRSDGERRYWVAHCLELDLVATAETEWKSVEMLAHLIHAQVAFSLKNNNLHNIEFRAPQKYFAELTCGEKDKP